MIRSIRAEALSALVIATTNTTQAMAVVEQISLKTPYEHYLIDGVLPDNKSEVSKLKAKAYDYCIHERSLYRKGKGELGLKRVTEAESQKILKELHDGVCGLLEVYP